MEEVFYKDERSSMDPDVYKAVAELCSAGWKLFRAGHGWRILCPCLTDEGRSVAGAPVPHTPSNPGSTARRLRRNAEHCPESHDLVR